MILLANMNVCMAAIFLIWNNILCIFYKHLQLIMIPDAATMVSSFWSHGIGKRWLNANSVYYSVPGLNTHNTQGVYFMNNSYKRMSKPINMTNLILQRCRN
jgi:hypothetical protein